MLYYISELYKKFVTRNNSVSTKPVKIFNHTVDEIEVSIVDQQNQLKQIPSGAFYFTGSFVKKAKATPIFLTTDYTVSGTTLTFKYSTYTYEFLNLVIGENVPIQVEIGYKDADGEHVILQDTAYASQRYYVEGMPDPSHVAEYYTKAETDEAIENAISGISGFVTEEQLEEDLAEKQNLITDEEKLDYSLISGAPTIPLSTSQLTNDSGFITETALQGLATETYVNEAVSGKADETALTEHTSDTTIHVTAEDKQTWNGKQDAITVDNKLDYTLLSGTPEIPDPVWGSISGTLSDQADLQTALDGKANTADIPTSTSQLTNDSDFVTGSDVGGLLSEYATTQYVDSAVQSIPLPTNVSELYNDADYQDAGQVQTAIDSAISGKQDAITNDNKLDYSLLSGTPSIPLSTSELINDSDFQTSTDVANAISGKAEKVDVDAISGELEATDEMLQDYIEEYNLLHTPFYVETLSANNYIKFNKSANDAPTVNLKYSYDNENWYDYTIGTDIEMTDIGDKIYFKGNNTAFGIRSSYKWNNLSSTYDINVGGNTNSLLNESMKVKQLNNSAFFALFFNASKLIDASKLMLPVRNLAYGCYSYMFGSCSNLKKAPYMLLAENPAENCYEAMFNGDNKLEKVPIIKLKTLTTLCVTQMFAHCRKLNDIEVHFTDWGDNYATGWMADVSASGTFKCPSGLDTTTRGVNTVPEGWTVVNI